MKEIVIISGKGGTGKTSIAGCFAAMAKDAVIADCDVDAADLHLILAPKTKQTHEFSGGKKARITADKCTACGKCAEVCHFNAISKDEKSGLYKVDEMSCEGCGVCRYFCPSEAIVFEDVVNGEWFLSETRFGTMVHARLSPGEENSGKLVSLLRKKAKEIAEQQGKKLVIVDGSPGTGCPVIASVTGADFALIVTEPTMSGLHDLSRVAELTKQLGVPSAVCINKYDINEDKSAEIERESLSKDTPVFGRVQYDKTVTDAQIAKVSLVEYADNILADQIKGIWRRVLNQVEAARIEEQNDIT